ncbi:MAG: energy-coupling factor ABC transporter permease [Armatimonadetes bacterium]|nr:energy-coupling factor ABC transporter permease [Armatimonadota bacterium]
MHIPDGYLSPAVWLAMDVVAVGAVAGSARVVEKRLGERQVPALAVTAAFIFAAQMINFPVAAGMSGHLLGGALAGILLGPWSGTLVMTTVVTTQCLLFRDGGLTALGANVFNMAILSVLAGCAVWRAGGALPGKGNPRAVAFAAAWVSVVLAALAAGLQLFLSGRAGPVVLAAMLAAHALIGIGEGLVTTAALSTLGSVRPDLLEAERV